MFRQALRVVDCLSVRPHMAQFQVSFILTFLLAHLEAMTFLIGLMGLVFPDWEINFCFSISTAL